MFIFNAEKEDLWNTVRTLQSQVAHLFKEVEILRAARNQESRRVALLTTKQAPWGFKVDGTPRARPGRKTDNKMEVKNAEPVSQ
jgi:hypothetical protein